MSAALTKSPTPTGLPAATFNRVLDEGYGPGAWYGADLRTAVGEVSDAAAFKRPAAGRHNIAEVALHHAYWAEQIAGKLTGALWTVTGLTTSVKAATLAADWQGNFSAPVGSITTTPSRIPAVWDWSRLPAPLTRRRVLGVALDDLVRLHLDDIRLVLNHRSLIVVQAVQLILPVELGHNVSRFHVCASGRALHQNECEIAAEGTAAAAAGRSAGEVTQRVAG